MKSNNNNNNLNKQINTIKKMNNANMKTKKENIGTIY